jgi:hypothetical protein
LPTVANNHGQFVNSAENCAKISLLTVSSKQPSFFVSNAACKMGEKQYTVSFRTSRVPKTPSTRQVIPAWQHISARKQKQFKIENCFGE